MSIDITLLKPVFNLVDTETQQGGFPDTEEYNLTDADAVFTAGLIPPLEDGISYAQYRKVFIQNSGLVVLNNVRVGLENNPNEIISYGVERNIVSEAPIINGGSSVINAHTLPPYVDFENSGVNPVDYSSDSSSTEALTSSSSSSVLDDPSSSSSSTEALSSSSSSDSTEASETSSNSSLSSSLSSSSSSQSSSSDSSSDSNSSSSSSSSSTSSSSSSSTSSSSSSSQSSSSSSSDSSTSESSDSSSSTEVLTSSSSSSLSSSSSSSSSSSTEALSSSSSSTEVLTSSSSSSQSQVVSLLSSNTGNFDSFTYLDAVTSANYFIDTAYTFTAFINIAEFAIGVKMPIYSQDNGGGDSVELYINSSGELTFEHIVGSSTSLTLNSTLVFSEEIWYQVGFQIDGTTARLIIDGATENTGTITISAIDVNDFLYLGVDYGGNLFAGFMGVGIIWDESLSTALLLENYNDGDPFEHSSLTGSILTNMLSYWPMENHTGFTGQELIDQQGSEDLNNGGFVSFTGTGLNIAQITEESSSSSSTEALSSSSSSDSSSSSTEAGDFSSSSSSSTEALTSSSSDSSSSSTEVMTSSSSSSSSSTEALTSSSSSSSSSNSSSSDSSSDSSDSSSSSSPSSDSSSSTEVLTSSSSSSNSSSSSSSNSSSSNSSSSNSSSSNSSSSSSSTEVLTSSSSSSGSGIVIPTLNSGESVGIWLRMVVKPTEAYNPEDYVRLYVISEEGVKDFDIIHRRYNLVPVDQRWKQIQIKNDFVRVQFDHVVDDLTQGGIDNQLYTAYVNGQRIEDFNGNLIDVPVFNMDTLFNLEIFSSPHEGFRHCPTPYGSNANLTFKARNGEDFDIDHFLASWDAGLGSGFLEDPITRLEISGEGSGSRYFSSEIVKKTTAKGFSPTHELDTSSSSSSTEVLTSSSSTEVLTSSSSSTEVLTSSSSSSLSDDPSSSSTEAMTSSSSSSDSSSSSTEVLTSSSSSSQSGGAALDELGTESAGDPHYLITLSWIPGPATKSYLNATWTNGETKIVHDDLTTADPTRFFHRHSVTSSVYEYIQMNDVGVNSTIGYIYADIGTGAQRARIYYYSGSVSGQLNVASYSYTDNFNDGGTVTFSINDSLTVAWSKQASIT